LKVLDGLLEAVPKDGEIWVEFTANGVGNWSHQTWQDSILQKNNWNPIFLPWSLDPDYDMDVPINPNWSLEEIALMREFNLSYKQLAWRRHKIMSMREPALFPQEYPLSADQAFLSSGQTCFMRTRLDEMWTTAIKPKRVGVLREQDGVVTFKDEPNGWLKIYQFPTRYDRYTIGGDPAEGVTGGDKTAAYVVENSSMSQVAEINDLIPPGVFADYLVLVARYYNKAKIACERNNHGHAVLLKISESLQYSNVHEDHPGKLGLNTSHRTKTLMIEELRDHVKSGSTHISSQEVLTQMRTFQYNAANGTYGGSEGCKDDLVMALAIAVFVAQREPVRHVVDYSGYRPGDADFPLSSAISQPHSKPNNRSGY
jgi:hypothetical protein